LDYWEHVSIVHWKNFDHFLSSHDERKLAFFTTKVTRPYTDASYNPGDFLIFGSESRGLSKEIRELYDDLCYTLPMSNPHIRSLNLAMAVGIVLYEALRQQL
jgi:tRNA (cytidine/uridine-2'-O-)-methyltransferase